MFFYNIIKKFMIMLHYIIVSYIMFKENKGFYDRRWEQNKSRIKSVKKYGSVYER